MHHCLEETALRQGIFKQGVCEQSTESSVAFLPPDLVSALSFLNTIYHFVTTDASDDDVLTRHPRSLPFGFATAGFFCRRPSSISQILITGHRFSLSCASLMRILFFLFLRTRPAMYEAWDACVRSDIHSQVLFSENNPRLLLAPARSEAHAACTVARLRPSVGRCWPHDFSEDRGELRRLSLSTRTKKCYRLQVVRSRRQTEAGERQDPNCASAGRLPESSAPDEARSGSITREAPARRT